MDDEQKFDPVTPEAKKDIRPGFLGGNGDDEKSARNSEATDDLRSAEKDASENAPKQNNDSDDAKKTEENPSGLYSGAGFKKNNNSKLKFASKLKKFAPVIIIVVLMLGILLLVTVGVPIIIGAIKENLFKNLGFKDTVAVLEKVAEYKVGNMLAEGKVPDTLAADLADNGLIVGQVTVAGEFIQTNNYIASYDEAEIAANGNYRNNSRGELAIKFGDEIVSASDFVVAVESSPKMYAAYSDAINIETKYYYSEDVDKVYDEKLGISRNPFGGWEATGDAEKDQKSFDEMLAKALDVNYNLDTAGSYYDWSCTTEFAGKAYVGDECGSETFTDLKTRKVITVVKKWVRDDKPTPWSAVTTGSSDAKTKNLMSKVRNGSRSDHDDGTNPNENAAQLLNTTISAGEPYIAASAFMSTVSAIEQAQAGDNGPVNELMNNLTTTTEITYRDVNTGKEVNVKKSILETTNFAAAVSDGEYSRAEANNFSRDRALVAASEVDSKAVSTTSILNTIVSSSGEKQSGLGKVMNNIDMDEPDDDVLDAMEDGVRLSVIEKSSETFSSPVGGNRIVEGGSFINNRLNQSVLGAMPSDQDTVMSYQHEVNEVLARQRAADRANKSPFDISSPNTFMGNLVRSFANTLIQSYSSDNVISVGRVLNASNNLLESSVGKITLGAYAEDDENTFVTMAGDCAVVGVVNVSGDLYCNSHNTLSTVNMNYTEEQWQKELSSSFSGGEIKKNGDLAKLMILGMDREATVGVKSAEVCARVKDVEENLLQKFFRKLVVVVTGAKELKEECDGVDDKKASGAYYTFSSSNTNDDGVDVKLLSAYVLHDKVNSLLTGEPSKVTAFMDEYYKEHPLDNSYEGRLARISGLSVEEVQLALQYNDYLTMLAQYNPSERYAFVIEIVDKPLRFDHEVDTMTNIYGVAVERTKYFDIRNRVYSV